MTRNFILFNSAALALVTFPVVIPLVAETCFAAEVTAEPMALTVPDRAQFLQTNRPATTVKEWMAQLESEIVQVTNITLNPLGTGLEIVLDTQDGKLLQVDATQFRREGDRLIAAIPNAVLALPDGQAFQRTNPTREIATVQVTQREGNKIQVVVSGNGTVPISDVVLKTGAIAYTLNPETDPLAEEEITVTGTRTPRPVSLSPANISVIDAQQIQQFLVQDLRDLLKYEPNVSVGNDRRYGLQDITIRGIGGNRVLILNDGIRIPTQFSFGTPSLGRDYVELETLQRLEVIRGPASALYGSDAVGGVVAFKTPDPFDVLARYGREFSLTGASTKYDTGDRGWTNNVFTVFRVGDFAGLVDYTRRDGNEARVPTDNEFVDSRTNARNNYLATFSYRLSDTSKLNLTAEVFRNEDDFAVADIIASDLVGPTGFRGQGETLENKVSRDRVSLEYSFSDPNSPGFLNAARVFVYWQDARVDETRTQDFVRTGAGSDRFRVRNLENEFSDRIIGGEVQLQSNFRIGTVLNKLIYGLDISSTDNERVRDGIQQCFRITGGQTPCLDSGRPVPLNLIGSDNFPVKDFPDSTTFRLGVYVQDEIEFSESFTLILGVRFDVYDLSTNPDDIYARNVGAVASDFNATAVSPNIGFVWRVIPELAITGRYARGFRSPLYSEINAGFTNLTSPFFRYKTLSNPDLEPETSDTFEVGLRGNFRQFNFSLTGFYNHYDNFIESFAPAGVDFTIIPGRPVNLFQSQNIGQARTYGFELGGEYRFSPDPYGFSLLTGIGLTIGDDLVNDQPLESVDPFKAVVGLRYRAPENRWGAELAATFVSQPRLRSDRPSNAYDPEGYTTVDLVAYYNFTPLISLNVGVFNLFNTQYFLYSDVRSLLESPEPRDIGRYAQPGINFRVGLTWRF